MRTYICYVAGNPELEKKIEQDLPGLHKLVKRMLKKGIRPVKGDSLVLKEGEYWLVDDVSFELIGDYKFNLQVEIVVDKQLND